MLEAAANERPHEWNANCFRVSRNPKEPPPPLLADILLGRHNQACVESNSLVPLGIFQKLLNTLPDSTSRPLSRLPDRPSLILLVDGVDGNSVQGRAGQRLLVFIGVTLEKADTSRVRPHSVPR
jgi:hypothetical protein